MVFPKCGDPECVICSGGLLPSETGATIAYTTAYEDEQTRKMVEAIKKVVKDNDITFVTPKALDTHLHNAEGLYAQYKQQPPFIVIDSYPFRDEPSFAFTFRETYLNVQRKERPKGPLKYTFEGRRSARLFEPIAEEEKEKMPPSKLMLGLVSRITK